MKHSTQCVNFEPADNFSAMSPPIYQTATFRQDAADEFGEFDYSRSGNPTRCILEEKLAQLEHGKFAAAFSSGMAAITAVIRLLKPDDEVIAGDELYGGTIRLLERAAEAYGFRVRYVDTTDADAVAATVSDKTRLVLIETPSNPTLRITDLKAVAATIPQRDVIFAVDNSMLSPTLQNPLDLGADIVIHSATKYLCGHSDVTGGAVITNDAELHKKIAFLQNAEGTALAPFDSWLLFRGLKTLALRVEKQSSNAEKIAAFLNEHPAVTRVFYPSLGDENAAAVQAAQARGNGGVISFTTGDAAASKRIAESVRLFSIAVSFGSVNSTVSLPCRMSHLSIPDALREKLAPPEDLIRISVGIEDADDLIADLTQALGQTAAASA
jgi:cystathionine beta-lyase